MFGNRRAFKGLGGLYLLCTGDRPVCLPACLPEVRDVLIEETSGSNETRRDKVQWSCGSIIIDADADAR